MDKYWIMVERGDFQEFTPYVITDDGKLSVILGMCLITSLEEMKKKAIKIVQVDDLYELTNPRVIHGE